MAPGEHMDKAFTVTMFATSIMDWLSARAYKEIVVPCEYEQEKRRALGNDIAKHLLGKINILQN